MALDRDRGEGPNLKPGRYASGLARKTAQICTDQDALRATTPTKEDWMFGAVAGEERPAEPLV